MQTSPILRTRQLALAMTIGGLVAAGVPLTPVQAGFGTPHRAPGVVAAPANQVEVTPPELRWHTCSAEQEFLDCTRARVPLDYDDPDGPTASILIARHEATDPERRIGSLFVNPGGPGGAASEFVSTIADTLGRAVAARFDIIGVDPRGVGSSTPLRCVLPRNTPGSMSNTVPLNAKQAKPLIRARSAIARACAQRSNAILDHMTTADTARDMDLIRRALGDEQLTYYGVSYGTYLGATYAAMFPQRVRAVVLDGVLDPIAWSTGRPGHARTVPFSARIRGGYGTWEALTSAFAECDRVGHRRCKFAGQAAWKWRRVVARLKRGPASDGFTYSDLVQGTLHRLYAPSQYRVIMSQINVVYRSLFDRHRPSRAAVHKAITSFRRASRNSPGPYGAGALSPTHGGKAHYPAYSGVACSDSLNPRRPRAWLRAGAVADRQSPWFGRAWTWNSIDCLKWPAVGEDAYRGPWRVETSHPLLVVGNFHDPATAISGARTVNSLFAGSRLLSVDTWGHGALGISDCVTKRTTRYLVSRRLPVDGLVCQPDKQLFPRRT